MTKRDKDTHINYTPAGPVAYAFHQARDALVRGLMGPVGSGKSVACVMELMTLAASQQPSPDGMRHSRWAIVRDTFPELETTTIRTFFQWFDKSWGRYQSKGPPTFFWEAGDIRAEFIFLALDKVEDEKKLMSLELTGIWFNEVRYTEQRIFRAALGRIGRYPAKRDGGPSWRGVIMDTNPPDTESWYYKYAEEETPAKFKFFRQPSGLSEEAENIQNIPAGREYYTDQMAGADPDYIKVYVKGEYGILVDGKAIFPQYVDATHCQEIEFLDHTDITIGMDFGLTPAAVILQRDPRGGWLAHRELVADSMGAYEFGQELKVLLVKHYPGVPITISGDPAGNQRAQTDERTVFEVLRRIGLPVRATPNNNLEARLEAVRGPLNRMVGGVPGFRIHPRCTVLRKALAGGYCYRKIKVSGTERFAEQPSKNIFSHVADALQYGLYGAGEGPRSIPRSGNRGHVRQKQTVSRYDALNHQGAGDYDPLNLESNDDL
jgi:hypothetical protein